MKFRAGIPPAKQLAHFARFTSAKATPEQLVEAPGLDLVAQENLRVFPSISWIKEISAAGLVILQIAVKQA